MARLPDQPNDVPRKYLLSAEDIDLAQVCIPALPAIQMIHDDQVTVTGTAPPASKDDDSAISSVNRVTSTQTNV